MMLRFLRDNIRIAAAFLLCAATFCVIFLLYDLPFGAALYALLLCALILAAFTAAAYFRVKHRKDALLDEEPRTVIECEYARLLKESTAALKRQNADNDIKARDMADFYTLWVHQIKTPIAAMHALIDAGGTGAQMEQELFKIERYCEMVLGYLRSDTMYSDLRLEECDVEKAAKAAVKKYAPVFIYKKIALDLAPISLRVVSDEKWLEFVIEQLLSNALKYTREGKISIYTRGEALFVEDTGCGIPQEDLPRVFERSFTGFNGRMDKTSTGLGLYLCKRILDTLGSSITITSQCEKGTCVRIDLSRPDVDIRD